MGSFEKKFGKYAIRNLSVVLIMFYAVGYLIQVINPVFLNYLTLDPYQILHGQVWRVISWLIVPPNSSNIIFVAIMLFFYYSIGTTLERTWGAFYYNIYILQGILFTVIAAFALMGYCTLFPANTIVLFGNTEYFYQNVAYVFSTYYVNMSIFLAFAATFPDAEVLLMFLIPIKVKWMGIGYGCLLVFQCIFGNVYSRFAIAASLLNFGVFWLFSRKRFGRLRSPKQVYRQQQYKHQAAKQARITRHKCAICGRNEETAPEMQFRFCSKCNGNYEYCEEHLYTHTHVQ